ncbi:branched-chain amino acid ABC transporter substrate-binding protein [Chryseobacterium salviniae]|uniref:Branched-chain amino acid ABC transporter substrate-binding protein n=1 Tax=Chryseobacterium salviniae TaxID=3101750 RepID=A0ABU6HSC6_9FLAO|nr:branched-chain amino acid ABC transporter substrate-binding protein [Chryseobacterium sp. T9W2-O]MEC3875803.1 branched-chain amino acid ABC transporter substrate-binding protein [Chryseobacterium sp. T9W2-O]
MNFDFFDFLDLCGNALNLFNGGSSDSIHYDLSDKKKKRKYVFEKISAVLYLISAVLFFFVFRNPTVSGNYTRSVAIASVSGFAVSVVIFFVIYLLGKYYFKSVFQWLFFSLSVTTLCVSVCLLIYFKSGIF